jgi:predicted dehydrogenase
MLKVAIIGCGKQADQHAAVIQDLPGCELVGVCDSEELMARQLYERFKVKQYFSDVQTLLESARPDVVHIITPPHAHLALGRLCLNAGCHVFFEKPFTLNAREAAEVLELAAKRRLKVTVGHNNQFNHVSTRMRTLIEAGFLGGDPVHMESNWCYDLGDKVFAKALLSNKSHWVRSLPGRLLHNIISHGIGRIAEFLEGDTAHVMAYGFPSPLVQSVNETDIRDELRVIIADSRNTTAYFTFSSQIYPRVQQFRVCGPKGSIVIDDMHQTLTTVVNTNYKYYLNHFVPPLLYAKQYFANAGRNIAQFMRNDFHFESGRKTLIEAFYRSITEDTPLPLSFREILLVARIMDEIFAQISASGTLNRLPEPVDLAV